VDRNGCPDASAAYYVLGEWADWQGQHDGTVPAESPEAERLYDAAVAVLCRWAGISDMAGFRRYLSHAQGGPAHV